MTIEFARASRRTSRAPKHRASPEADARVPQTGTSGTSWAVPAKIGDAVRTSRSWAMLARQDDSMPAITIRGFLLATVVLLAATTRVSRAESPPPDPNHWLPVQVAWDQKIAMRDGVRISATIYRNPKQTAPVA